MNVLFPQNSMMNKLPEPVFETEFDAAISLGIPCYLYDEMAFTDGEYGKAFKKLPDGPPRPLLYRGWIRTEEEYRTLYETLHAKGFTLISSPDQYAQVTFFPNYYPKIRSVSPPAVWTDQPDTYQAWTMARKLGDGPFVLKDHVKSAKHLWHEACFVPQNSGREKFEHIAETLKREQGKSFFRGFVVKQYVPLRSRGDSPREYPMCEEYRLFFWNRQLLTASHYHRQPANNVDWTPFIQLAQAFDAPFFSMDVALTEKGDWIVVDMGAGECSSLPPDLNPVDFYRKLQDKMKL